MSRIGKAPIPVPGSVNVALADRQITVPESVITHLVRQLERSPAAIRDFISQVSAVG